MIDWLWTSLKLVMIAAALSPVAIGIGWALLEGLILPRLIPREAIDALAETVMRGNPEDPEGWAYMEEHAAWHRSQMV